MLAQQLYTIAMVMMNKNSDYIIITSLLVTECSHMALKWNLCLAIFLSRVSWY